MTRVKICGLTQTVDVANACAAGADALGFVFYEPSKRFVRIETAKQLCKAVPPFVQRVGLFVNPTADYVRQVLAEVELDLLQFHGDESAAFCESFSLSYIKALAVKPGVNLQQTMQAHKNARAFLLDTYKPGVPGGTGETFDWQLFPAFDKPLILAGGLQANNVALAVQTLAPYAVDVSGGVELSAGIKSAEKMQAFVKAAKHIEENCEPR